MVTETDQLLGNTNPTNNARALDEHVQQITKRLTHAAVATIVVVLGIAMVVLNRSAPDDRYTPFSATTLGASRREEARLTKDEKRDCDDGDYSKRTLKKAYEMPFAALFKDLRGQKKFEASDIIKVGDYLYSVCDSSWAISKFASSLLPFAESNIQIGEPNRETDSESGYEGIIHADGIFYVVRESVLHSSVTSGGEPSKGRYHAIVEELLLSDTDYDIVAKCRSEFEFEGDSKGFEGAIGIQDSEGTLTILGLCEGNHCSEKRKKDRGNGQLVMMQKLVADDGSCMWKTLKMIDIPSSANFLDYSSITLDKNGRVAISSQEDSKIWLGKLEGLQADGTYDLKGLALVDENGTDKSKIAGVYGFPKNDDCDVVYCNIEGIHWLDDNMFVAVSDKMKSKGKQAFRCFDKDQSVHTFVLP